MKPCPQWKCPREPHGTKPKDKREQQVQTWAKVSNAWPTAMTTTTDARRPRQQTAKWQQGHEDDMLLVLTCTRARVAVRSKPWIGQGLQVSLCGCDWLTIVGYQNLIRGQTTVGMDTMCMFINIKVEILNVDSFCLDYHRCTDGTGRINQFSQQLLCCLHNICRWHL